MYIKQIIIEGFKSYGQRTVMSSLDPQLNVVVGKNGSGKSNLFLAIQFVLSNEMTYLKAQEREALLYGSGHKVISASVEIQFDNSDRRLSIDSDNVSLRREIGLKTDIYTLNKKPLSRCEVNNLLEAAGFSKSNPYYIVKQGKINEMVMTPESRLKLLSEIAGTKIYEEKRQESIVILKGEEVKLNKIQEILTTLDEKLSVLKEEMEEFEEYQKWKKKRRAIEYIIHERTLMNTKEQEKEKQELHENLQQELDYFVFETETKQKQIKQESQKLKRVLRIIKYTEEQIQLLKAEQEIHLKDEAELKYTINDLSDEVKSNNKNLKDMEQELEKLNAEIKDKETQLQHVKFQYENMVQTEEELLKNFDLKEQQCKVLYSRQGRSAQFKNKEERDLWIKEQLSQLKHQIEDKKVHQKNVEEVLRKDKEMYFTLEKQINECLIEMERQKDSIDNFNKQFYSLNKEKDILLAKRKDLYQEDIRLQNNLETLKEDLSKINNNLRSIFGTSKINGKNSVNKVLDRFREHSATVSEIEKYCGLVIEMFDCEEKLYTAIEVTATSRLFNHVVETNEFANKIVKELNVQLYPGEVTFMPLDRIKVNFNNYPEIKNAFPLISKLKYDPKYEAVFRFIFGRTYLCRDLDVATEISRKYKLDCVTLDGNQVSSQGWLKGGNFTKLKSSMEIQKERSSLLNKINKTEHDLSNLKNEIGSIDQYITSYISEIQCIETKLIKARDIYYKAQDEVNMMKKELNRINKNKIALEKNLQKHRSALETMQDDEKNLEDELRQNLTNQISVSDEHQINNLNDSIAKLRKELKEVSKKRQQLETEKNELESLLVNYLNPSKDQLTQSIQDILIENKQLKLEGSKDRLLFIQNNFAKNKKLIEDQENILATAIKEQMSLELEIDELKKEEKDLIKKTEKRSKVLDKLHQEEKILKQTLTSSSQKMNDLRVIPNSNLYSTFKKRDTSDLHKILKETKNQLKKFSNVNKKSSSQFQLFKDQRNKLFKRKEELDNAFEKIRMLLDALQQRKYEVVEFTFKQVSKYFTEIFKQLVPMGNAYLSMQPSNGGKKSDISSTDNSVCFDDFVGIEIKVSFSTNSDKMRNMNQLSGGQKSLVTLSLIFAIQKCDPAPFYLFDEIDQALDTEHREAVANMLYELSSKAQFITTTFRKEFLERATKCYGIKFHNNLSYIESISHEEAMDLLEENES